MSKTYTGRCVCGDVSYQASNVKAMWYCHCEQCRRMTGHHMAAAQVAPADIEINGQPKWYYVSDVSRHGFCPNCGSQLFWRNDTNEYLSITGGGLDDATGIEFAGHVYVGEKGEYYELNQADLKYIANWS